MSGTDPILLVGPQRSGTTALALALSRALAAEGGCFTVNGKLPYLLRRWWNDADAAAAHLRVDEVAHALERIPPKGEGSTAWLARAQDALLASSRRAAAGDVPPSTVAEARRVCCEAYGSGPWGDKYNEYLLELPWLNAMFPGARWVFLVREPHESVASMLAWAQDKPWNPGTEAAASTKWAYWTSRWLAFRSTVPVPRRLELDYASLCEGRCDSLSEFVGSDVAPFLSEFRRQSPGRPAPTLRPEAITVRDALVRTGILSDRARPSILTSGSSQ
jgi:hypothetical protein